MLRSIRKSFQAIEVLKGVSLDVAEGEFVVFVGPSGCGKSTLLRIIAGLEEQGSGHVIIDGTTVGIKNVALVWCSRPTRSSRI
jgi:ABC-type sugar transport system ATPase subunit